MLAINCRWTLPEKLLSLQKMFGSLSRPQLVRLCCSQPLLLTSSIERNMRVADFLSSDVGLSQEQLRSMLQACPRVAMTGLPVLRVCWGVLTNTYGLSAKQAKAAVRHSPQLLTRQLLTRGLDRLHFFSNEMGVAIVDGVGEAAFAAFAAANGAGAGDASATPVASAASAFGAGGGGSSRGSSKDGSGSNKEGNREGSSSGGGGASAKSLALRCPALLYLDTDIFLRPNLALLRRYLGLDTAGIRKMVAVFPQLLTHNPATLERACVSSLWLLTGLEEYRDGAEGGEGMGREGGAGVDLIGDIAESGSGTNTATTTSFTASSSSTSSSTSSSSEGVVRRKLLRLSHRSRGRLDPSPPHPLTPTPTHSAAAATASSSPRAAPCTEDPAALLRRCCCPLALPLARAQHTLAACPWILSYRPGEHQSLSR